MNFPKLDIEVRTTSRRFSKIRGQYGAKMYMSLAGSDGEPGRLGRTFAKQFLHGDKLTILRTSDLAKLVERAQAAEDLLDAKSNHDAHERAAHFAELLGVKLSTPRANADRIIEADEKVQAARQELLTDLVELLGGESWGNCRVVAYDRALELDACAPTLALNDEQCTTLWLQGFQRIYLNHLDDMQTVYFIEFPSLCQRRPLARSL